MSEPLQALSDVRTSDVVDRAPSVARDIETNGLDSPLNSDDRFESESLRVVEISLEDPRLVSFVNGHTRSTIYHHPAWLRALDAEYHRPIVIIGCETPDGRLVGMFPLIHTRGLSLPIGG